MREVVRNYFAEFSEKFEGSVPWMYQDILGLVSTGIGNLIDPVPLAITLPWVWKTDGRTATVVEIKSEWSAVKAHPGAAKDGHLVLKDLTNLRLTPEGLQQVVLQKLDLNTSLLRARFPDFDQWPAEAQLATHSMAWACGPAFRFPLLAAALKAQDFREAAKQCHIDDSHNPGVTPRNAANVYLYTRAQQALDIGENFDLLEYPAGTTHGAVPEDNTPNDMPIIHPELDLSAAWDAVKKDVT